jgi:hypothetical protein
MEHEKTRSFNVIPLFFFVRSKIIRVETVWILNSYFRNKDIIHFMAHYDWLGKQNAA